MKTKKKAAVSQKPASKKPVKKAAAKKVAKKPARELKGIEHVPADAIVNDDQNGSQAVTASHEVVDNIPVATSNAATETRAEKWRKNFKKNFERQDNIYIDVELKNLSELTGLKVRNGFSVAIVADNEIVNVVSPSYGLVKNEEFFIEVERQLIEADIKYKTRQINRSNSAFSVEYILQDEEHHVNVKNGKDKIIPILRFTNTYGGGPCAGNLGFYREICANGLHIAETKVSFKVKHRTGAIDIALPNIKDLVGKFLDNEFFSLQKKFNVLAETPITDLNGWVKMICTEMDLFKYEASEKNPDTPSKKAQEVLDTIAREAKQLEVSPNLWLGYNAFNAIIHESEKKSFTSQRKTDTALFNHIYETVAQN